MTLSDTRWIVRGGRMGALAALTLLAAGCVSGSGAGVAGVDAAVLSDAPRGFVFHGSVVKAGVDGLRAHGSICRTEAGPLWPGQVSLELLNPDGTSAARASRSIANQARAAGYACAVYDLPTAWRPRADQSLRLSAD